ncbi:MAG: IS4 family transposase [Planctomycetia bacterium]
MVLPPESWLWKSRRVLAGDGSTFTMADTDANQKEYPQQKGQKAGCGFPIMRALVLFSLSVGSVIEAAIGPYSGKQTGENSLLRTLHATLRSGDVLLLDRYFSSWFDIVMLMQLGIDVVVRKHQLRATDFRKGKRLGKDDQLVILPKPAKPPWMDSETCKSLPDSLQIREIRVRVIQPGFRTKSLIVTTTLLDSQKYSHDDLATVYRMRWHAELNLRSLKTVMQMDHLRCKEPHRVRNEFYMHLLAYNLIRQVMAEAGLKSGVCPCQISFKGTIQTLNQFLPMWSPVMSTDDWYHGLMETIATHIVADRPNRIEPRCRKRRPKKHKNLREDRAAYKKRFCTRG